MAALCMGYKRRMAWFFDRFFQLKCYTMRVNDNEFPVVVQAFDTKDKYDEFVAEQVVSNQVEVDTFTSRYAGKLIKVRHLSNDEVKHDYHPHPARKRTTSGAGIWLLLLLVIVALVVVGFTTGWVQKNLGWNVGF
jgi:hypothetical protein